MHQYHYKQVPIDSRESVFKLWSQGSDGTEMV